MRRLLLTLLASFGLAAAHTAQAAPSDEDTLRSTVRSFIADYEAWNDAAQRASEKSDPIKAMDEATLAYGKIIARYCPPGYRHQGIAFGSESSHSVANEQIVGVQTKGTHAVVRTKHAKARFSVDLSSHYEYHFTQTRGHWYLARLLVVVDKEKLESL